MDKDCQQKRQGRWTVEEDDFLKKLIELFQAGLLRIQEGSRLRTFLAESLQCEPMRITKKLHGGGGERAKKRTSYRRDVLASPSALDAASAELQLLEARSRAKIRRCISSTPNEEENKSGVCCSKSAIGSSDAGASLALLPEAAEAQVRPIAEEVSSGAPMVIATKKSLFMPLPACRWHPHENQASKMNLEPVGFQFFAPRHATADLPALKNAARDIKKWKAPAPPGNAQGKPAPRNSSSIADHEEEDQEKKPHGRQAGDQQKALGVQSSSRNADEPNIEQFRPQHVFSLGGALMSEADSPSPSAGVLSSSWRRGVRTIAAKITAAQRPRSSHPSASVPIDPMLDTDTPAGAHFIRHECHPKSPFMGPLRGRRTKSPCPESTPIHDPLSGHEVKAGNGRDYRGSDFTGSSHTSPALLHTHGAGPLEFGIRRQRSNIDSGTVSVSHIRPAASPVNQQHAQRRTSGTLEPKQSPTCPAMEAGASAYNRDNSEPSNHTYRTRHPIVERSRQGEKPHFQTGAAIQLATLLFRRREHNVRCGTGGRSHASECAPRDSVVQSWPLLDRAGASSSASPWCKPAANWRHCPKHLPSALDFSSALLRRAEGEDECSENHDDHMNGSKDTRGANREDARASDVFAYGDPSAAWDLMTRCHRPAAQDIVPDAFAEAAAPAAAGDSCRPSAAPTRKASSGLAMRVVRGKSETGVLPKKVVSASSEADWLGYAQALPPPPKGGSSGDRFLGDAREGQWHDGSWMSPSDAEPSISLPEGNTASVSPGRPESRAKPLARTHPSEVGPSTETKSRLEGNGAIDTRTSWPSATTTLTAREEEKVYDLGSFDGVDCKYLGGLRSHAIGAMDSNGALLDIGHAPEAAGDRDGSKIRRDDDANSEDRADANCVPHKTFSSDYLNTADFRSNDLAGGIFAIECTRQCAANSPLPAVHRTKNSGAQAGVLLDLHSGNPQSVSRPYPSSEPPLLLVNAKARRHDSVADVCDFEAKKRRISEDQPERDIHIHGPAQEPRDNGPGELEGIQGGGQRPYWLSGAQGELAFADALDNGRFEEPKELASPHARCASDGATTPAWTQLCVVDSRAVDGVHHERSQEHGQHVS